MELSTKIGISFIYFLFVRIFQKIDWSEIRIVGFIFKYAQNSI